MRETSHSSHNSSARNWVTGLLIAAAILALSEFTLFIFDVDYRQDTVVIRNEHDPEQKALRLTKAELKGIPMSALFNLIKHPVTTPDPELIFRVRPNPGGLPVDGYTGINRLGFRGPELTAESNKKTILFLGGSCAFGWMIPDYSHTIAGQLQELLGDAGEDYAVFNLGQPGYSTTQGLKLYRKWVNTIKPDIMILYFGWNDMWPTPLFTDKQTMEVLRFSDNPVVGFLRTTRLYALMSHGFSKLGLIKGPQPNDMRRKEKVHRMRVPIKEAVENYKIMVEMADRAIIILPPFSSDKFLGMESYKKIIARALKGHATIVRLPKMEFTSPDTKEYFSGDGFHPNEKGASLIANRLKDLILQNQ